MYTYVVYRNGQIAVQYQTTELLSVEEMNNKFFPYEKIELINS